MEHLLPPLLSSPLPISFHPPSRLFLSPIQLRTSSLLRMVSGSICLNRLPRFSGSLEPRSHLSRRMIWLLPHLLSFPLSPPPPSLVSSAPFPLLSSHDRLGFPFQKEPIEATLLLLGRCPSGSCGERSTVSLSFPSASLLLFLPPLRVDLSCTSMHCS